MDLSRRTLLGAAPRLPPRRSCRNSPTPPRPSATSSRPPGIASASANSEATVVSDGRLPLGDPIPAFPASPPQEIAALMQANFLPVNAANLEQNALIVNTGRQLVLFDTGMGDSMGAASQMFGPTTGRCCATCAPRGSSPRRSTW
jgi:hypothetical protein